MNFKPQNGIKHILEFVNPNDEFEYPFPPEILNTGKLPWNPSFIQNLRAKIDYYARPSHRNRCEQIELKLLSPSDFRPLSPADFPLIFLTHNSQRYLRSFLAHYRALGVTRFLCVDDQSTDAGLDHLLSQADVDIYTSNVRYSEANRGRAWREMLANKYGLERWYLNVDSDEYFIYETIDKEDLHAYSDRLMASGFRRVCAPMLDLYPVTSLDEAVFDGANEQMPWEVASHFDGDGYSASRVRKGISICGGIRRRLLGAYPELVKYPLLYWDPSVSLAKSIHLPAPSRYNFCEMTSVLLHFKIFSDFREEICRIIENGQHINGSAHYKKLLNGFDRLQQSSLGYEKSIQYTGPKSLVDLGFVWPLVPDKH